MSVLETAIGWLAPPHCVNCGYEGVALCAACTRLLTPFGPRCWRCNRLSPLSRTCDACRRIGSPAHVYIRTGHSGLARELLQTYKFGHQRSAASAIARLMLETLPAAKPDYLIIPVPTVTSHIRERGFDHSLLLARQISAVLKAPCEPGLRRVGQAHQVGARRQDRLEQLAGSFSVKNPKRTAGQNILLIDDVVTTGGTIIAAAQALRQAGAARVDALLFAKRL